MKDKIEEMLDKIKSNSLETNKDAENKVEKSAEDIEKEKKDAEEKQKLADAEKIKGTETFIERLKKQGFELNTEEDVEKYVLSTKTKIDEYTTKESDYTKTINELKGYKETIDQGFDPLQFFSSVEAYKREQLKKQLPSIPIDVADKVVSADLNAMTPEQLIAMDYRIKYPTLTDSEVKDMINDKYGDAEDRSNAKVVQMKVDASDSIKNILTLRGTVKDPEKIDPRVSKEENEKKERDAIKKLEEDWSRVANTIKHNQLVISDVVDGKEQILFTQEVEGDFNAQIQKDIVQYCKENRLPVTQETIEYAMNQTLDLYKLKNYVKTHKLYAKQEVEKARKEWEKENLGMGGHVSRQADGSITLNQITERDKQKWITGADPDSSGIKPLKY